MRIEVIGGGLAGSEAAWRIANSGLEVTLYEMRPLKMTPAHQSDRLAELVCSNTLGSLELTTGAGLLKAEMNLLNSLIMEAAKHAYVPAGSALGVDRKLFAEYITRRIEEHPGIELVRKEVDRLPLNNITVVATGPLTSDRLYRGGIQEVLLRTPEGGNG